MVMGKEEIGEEVGKKGGRGEWLRGTGGGKRGTGQEGMKGGKRGWERERMGERVGNRNRVMKGQRG